MLANLPNAGELGTGAVGWCLRLFRGGVIAGDDWADVKSGEAADEVHRRLRRGGGSIRGIELSCASVDEE